MRSRYDAVVIGGGAGGLSAALAARGRKASVLIVERSRLGGDCTWTGCVPSKALIDHAARVAVARSLGAHVEVDLAAVLADGRATIDAIAQDESAPVLQRYGIDVAFGSARFRSSRSIDVDGVVVEADRVVIATGTVPEVPPVPGADDSGVLTNETVFDLTDLPPRLVVVGGGAVGVELAQAFARLGSQVTVWEAAERILGDEEPETSRVVQQSLERDGVTIQGGAGLDGMQRIPGGLQLSGTGVRTVVGDAVLVSVGRRATTGDLDLHRAGVVTDERGFIPTDSRLRTSAANIYAVGDVTGQLQFTHAADEMGRIAVANALSKIPRRFWSPRAVPWAVFTDPEVGRVGMTEAQAHAEHGDKAQVAHLDLAVTDRARVAGRTAGFIKLIAAPHPIARGLAGGQIVGATVVSPAAAEVVQEVALVMKTRALAGRLAQTVHAYPAWSIALRQAAAQLVTTTAHGRARPARPG